jgi:putative phosphonate metabolism protein
MEPRYAIYYAPELGSPLSSFGWSWLGRHADTEAYCEPARPPSLPADRFAEIIAKPRRYGFHATLVAPFRLAPNRRREDLVVALSQFAAAWPRFTVAPPSLQELRGFLALRLSQPDPKLEALAMACVTSFSGFRAPLTADDLARRKQAALSARQLELLDLWGYPYVAEQFDFHMTLTDRLADEERQQVFTAAQPLVAPACRPPLAVNSLCLFEQAGPERQFVLSLRFALGDRI